MSRSQSPLVVIPVFNHGETLPEVVTGCLRCGHQVLVVDDGSDDGCLERIAHLDCTCLRLPDNRGKGAAILAGAEAARKRGYETIVTIDADGQHAPADIDKLIRASCHCDAPALIIGARDMGSENVPDSSRFGNTFSNFWVRLECGCELTDTQSGFRLYPVKELLALHCRRKRYDFEIEAIVRLSWAGVPVTSVPVSVHYPPAGSRVSHFHKGKDNLRLSLLHTRLVLRRLLPLPHRRLSGDISLNNQVKKTLRQNPFRILAELCREHASPFWIGTAVWLGIFMGALPLIACHTVAIIYVAHRLHLNKVAAVAASQLCMPPLVPVLCIQTGYFLRNGSFLLDLSWQRWLLEIHQRLFEWLLGSLVIGPLLGFIVGAIIFWSAQRLQLRRQRS